MYVNICIYRYLIVFYGQYSTSRETALSFDEYVLGAHIWIIHHWVRTFGSESN